MLKNCMKRLPIFIIALIFISGTISVNAESSSVQKTYIQLTKSEVSLRVGEVAQINAILKYAKSAKNISKSAAWKIENSSIATVEAGKVRALAEGTTQVKVTYKSYSASFKIVVLSQEKKIVKIVLSKDKIEMQPDEEQALIVTAYFADNSTLDVTQQVKWNIEDPQTVSIVGGKIKALSEGETAIIATIGDRKASAEVIVTSDSSQPVNLEASVSRLELKSGESRQITITAYWGDETQKDVSGQAEWSIENGNSICVLRNGSIIALKPGKAVIKISYQGLETYINLTVPDSVNTGGNINGDNTPASGNSSGATGDSSFVKKLTGITVSSSSLDMKQGDSISLIVTAAYSDNSKNDITAQASWTTENAAIASVTGGTVIAAGPGFTTIKAGFGNLSSAVPVKVITTSGERTLIGIRFPVNNLTIKVGQNYTLNLTAYYSDGSSEDITSLASWSVGNVSVATASNGIIAGVSGGNTVIMVEYQGRKTYANVKVTRD